MGRSEAPVLLSHGAGLVGEEGVLFVPISVVVGLVDPVFVVPVLVVPLFVDPVVVGVVGAVGVGTPPPPPPHPPPPPPFEGAERVVTV